MAALEGPVVRVGRLLEGAAQAEGTVVVIDVFRAFSVCAYAAALGARPLIVVADAERARAFKASHPRAVLSGESGGWPLPGFDLGNSPSELLARTATGLEVRGRPFVQRTSAGTQGVFAARRARQVFVAGLVNAAATAAVVRALRPEVVTLVAMGSSGRALAEEDETCARAIEAYLTGQPWDAAAALEQLYGTERVRFLLSGGFAPFPPSDVQLCLAFNLFPFALRARRVGDLAVIRPMRAPLAGLGAPVSGAGVPPSGVGAPLPGVGVPPASAGIGGPDGQPRPPAPPSAPGPPPPAGPGR